VLTLQAMKQEGSMHCIFFILGKRTITDDRDVVDWRFVKSTYHDATMVLLSFE
jgi:hypothetical protein